MRKVIRIGVLNRKRNNNFTSLMKYYVPKLQRQMTDSSLSAYFSQSFYVGWWGLKVQVWYKAKYGTSLKVQIFI